MIVYDEYQGTGSQHTYLKRLLNIQQQQTKTYSGTMTKGAKKRLTKTVDMLLQLSPKRQIYSEVLGKEITHRLSFITLTISESGQNLTAKEAYQKLLLPFLRWLTRTKGVKTYIWKAELQKRGQIHYHITTPSFINWKEIRSKWNNLQRAEGLLDDFYKKFKHLDPNSTDVHEVYKADDLTGYMIKYLAKAESQEDKTTGKLWDCSSNLKGLKYPTFEMTRQQDEFLRTLAHLNYLRPKHLDRCTILQMKGYPGKMLLADDNLTRYDLTIKDLISRVDAQLLPGETCLSRQLSPV